MDIIEGFVVSGTTEVTVANVGHAVTLALKHPRDGSLDVTLSTEQSERLRRLLRGAERRAA